MTDFRVIANPSSGKDIRRLVAHGAPGHAIRFTPHSMVEVMPIPCVEVVLDP